MSLAHVFLCISHIWLGSGAIRHFEYFVVNLVTFIDALIFWVLSCDSFMLLFSTEIIMITLLLESPYCLSTFRAPCCPFTSNLSLVPVPHRLYVSLLVIHFPGNQFFGLGYQLCAWHITKKFFVFL